MVVEYHLAVPISIPLEQKECISAFQLRRFQAEECGSPVEQLKQSNCFPSVNLGNPHKSESQLRFCQRLKHGACLLFVVVVCAYGARRVQLSETRLKGLIKSNSIVRGLTAQSQFSWLSIYGISLQDSMGVSFYFFSYKCMKFDFL